MFPLLNRKDFVILNLKLEDTQDYRSLRFLVLLQVTLSCLHPRRNLISEKRTHPRDLDRTCMRQLDHRHLLLQYLHNLLRIVIYTQVRCFNHVWITMKWA